MEKEELYYNKETGEIMTATQAIHEFYETDGHGIMENWFDAYEFFGYADTPLEKPDFIKVLNI